MTPNYTLNPAQQAVFDHGLLESGFSVVLQMPTGSGKTWLAKQAIRDSLRRGLRAVYLSPLRALADELVIRWQEEFAEVPVGVFTGDYGRPGRSLPVSYQDARILIMTPERLDACTRIWRTHWTWIPEVDWLVVDEIHLLGDGHRGARLEGTLSRFHRLNPFCRVLGLSATLGNREEIADWLEAVEWQTDWRPVPLEWKTIRYRKPEDKPDLLMGEISRVSREGGQSLVFVQSRRKAEQLAGEIRERGLHADFHHAGLTHGQRRQIEDRFRSGVCKVLVATSTLEMGLNLPARQVVLYDLQGFDGVGFEPLSVNTVWQRAGRAGRPSLDPVGEVVLMAPAWDREVERYARGRFEPIRSGLSHPAFLAEQVLAEVHSGLARTPSQLERLLSRSLAARQKQKLPVADTIHTMIQSGMLREDEETSPPVLRATRLGRIACRHQLQPATVLKLRQFLEAFDEFTDFDLLLIAASTLDCEPRLPVDFETLENLAEEFARQPSRLFEQFNLGASILDVKGRALLSSLKISLVLWRWTVLGDLESVADEEGCYPFEIRRLIESMDRLLLAAGAIRRGFDLGSREESEETAPKSSATLRIELLRQKVLNGVEGPAAGLTLVDGIGASWARRLMDHGIRDLAELGECSPSDLSQIPGISEKRASAWIEQAKERHQLEPPAVEAKGIPTLPPDTDLPVDPYRLRRAVDLKVSAQGGNRWEITGGSEPRQVLLQNGSLSCSCPDHAKGRICKHILAVNIHQDDPEVCRFLALMSLDCLPLDSYLDLFSLWFQRS